MLRTWRRQAEARRRRLSQPEGGAAGGESELSLQSSLTSLLWGGGAPSAPIDGVWASGRQGCASALSIPVHVYSEQRPAGAQLCLCIWREEGVTNALHSVTGVATSCK